MRLFAFLILVVSGALAMAEEFTVVALPDTQFYSQDYPETYDAQTRWIVEQRRALNIRFVTHLGDIVNVGTDPNEYYQWQNAKAAMSRLEIADVPHGTCIGNHDIWGSEGGGFSGGGYDPNGAYYLQNFGPQFYRDRPWTVSASPSGLSNAQVITVGGRSFLFLHLLVETPAAELAWAQGVLNANRDKPTMVSTHRYLHDWGPLGQGRYNDFNYFFEPLYRHDGIKSEAFFENFVAKNRQIFAVLCGHNAGEYRQVSQNDFGLPVHEILADYQSGYGNGGNGYLRILKFRPDANRIDVQTFSPTLNSYRTGDESQFSIPVNFNDYRVTGNVIRFQEGANGYAGTQDTWVNEDAKNSSYGNDATVWVDDDTANSWFNDYQGQGLLRWGGMFQGPVREGDPEPTLIPLGAAIVRADVTIVLEDDTEIGNPEFYVHKMIRDWNESSTWNSLSNGIELGRDCSTQRLATFFGDNDPNGEFRRQFSIRSAVSDWSAGMTNYGICFLPQRVNNNDDGIEIWSSESGTATNRPLLEVEFTYDVVNAPPIVTLPLNADPTTIDEGEFVDLAFGARDPNPLDPLIFRINGEDVGFATGRGLISVQREFFDEGVFTFRGTVTDDVDTVDAGTATVTVRNVAPRITSLTRDLEVLQGRTFAFQAAATDPGRNDVLTFRWDLDNDGQFDDFTGGSGRWSFYRPGQFRVSVRVDDGDGGAATGSFVVTVRGPRPITPAP